MKLNTDEILNKNVSRQEFLKYTGAAIMAVAGISSILKSFNLFGDSISSQINKSSNTQTANYGSNTYGGKKDKNTLSRS